MAYLVTRLGSIWAYPVLGPSGTGPIRYWAHPVLGPSGGPIRYWAHPVLGPSGSCSMLASRALLWCSWLLAKTGLLALGAGRTGPGGLPASHALVP